MPAPYSTLQQIYTKVRRLVRAPSANQLSDDEINNYVNTFVLYDLPEALRLWNLRKTFTFYTTPYVDTYPLGNVDEGANPDNQFYNFKNKYITIHQPLYIAGFQRFYTQSREQFFGMYPQIQSITTTTTGTTQVINLLADPGGPPANPANFTIPGYGVVLYTKMDVTTPFKGGALSAMTLSIGKSGGSATYLQGAADVWTAAIIQEAGYVASAQDTAWTVNVSFAPTSAAVSAATAGQVDIYILFLDVTTPLTSYGN